MSMSMTVMLVLIGVGLAQIYFIVRMQRAFADLAQTHERVSRLGAAVGVLTDTCECGFRTLADEIGRALEDVSRPAPPRREATRRVRDAARKGLPLAAIAASEQMSEGEVRLRLQMPMRPSKTSTRKEGKHRAVRPS